MRRPSCDSLGQVSWACLAAAAALAFTASASEARLKVLHSFCAEAGCADGSQPRGDLLVDASGNLFGTAASGGAGDAGVVYELRHVGGEWRYKTLHEFCSQPDCDDGATPLGKLIADVHGNLYGVTYARVAHGGGGGVAFKLMPAHGRWKFKTLHKFCSRSNCADGFGAIGGLTYRGAESGALYDGVSALYGMTAFGGAVGQGLVYSLAPGASGWSEHVIHDFCTETEECGLSDGGEPIGALIVDSLGNLYGATASGGVNFDGTLFKLSPASGRKWSETILHSFCADLGCDDGAMPVGVTMDAAGNLYGATEQYGANGQGGNLFRLSSAGSFEVLHDFCAEADCADGRQPFANVALDASGNLFGTTISGGGNDIDQNHFGGGVAFAVPAGGSFTVLHRFCGRAACADGQNPMTALTPAASGRIFGTTAAGGAFAKGEIFELIP